MGGRQAHGRSLLTNPKTKSTKKSKTKLHSNALDAFNIASKQYPTVEKRTPRARQLDIEPGQKHEREPESDEDDEEGPRNKKRVKRPSTQPTEEDSEVEYGSDDEGNEWRVGGPVNEDEDSEIDSDEAFGESDDEQFQGYAFGGGKSKNTKGGGSTDEDEEEFGDDGESLGEDAIDLAQALDQAEDESSLEGSESGSDSASESESEASEGIISESSDDEGDEDHKQGALQGLASEFAGFADGKATGTTQKLDLKDLGLTGVSDPHMKKALKLMTKEERDPRPGVSKKLVAPLPKRIQDRVERKAAYEKTNETLDRWTETVKHNRRAEHLVFPLPQNLPSAGLGNTELQTLNIKNATSELEQTMMSILEQSGLSLDKNETNKGARVEEEAQSLSKAERDALANEKRLQRDLHSREAKRSKRIKKIKSKAYHRVHRREQEKDDALARDAMAGDTDSEAEKEDQDRQRALERVGARHRNSKWAKSGAKVKRAVWDDDYRTSLVDMARREEELRKRKDGRTNGSDDDSQESDSDAEGSVRGGLRAELDRVMAENDDEPESKLMQLKFMRRAEETRRKENDALVAQIRKDLGTDDDMSDQSDEEKVIGRKHYGTGVSTAFALTQEPRKPKQNKDADEALSLNPSRDQDDEEVEFITDTGPLSSAQGDWSKRNTKSAESVAPGSEDWARSGARKEKKRSSTRNVGAELDLSTTMMVKDINQRSTPRATPKISQDTQQPRKETKTSTTTKIPSDQSSALGDSDDDDTPHPSSMLTAQELIAQAFAGGDDTLTEFEREKAEIAEEEDDKVIDNTLPGWGSWVGEGVGAKEKKRHQGRFLTKVQGVKKKDRKDAKLERVIINEKRVKKNDKYLATQLPHPFESRDQYERSLRLPAGREWITKASFQDATKPRILMKQGVITPISRPVL